MGLDLFVRKERDFRQENGRQCYTVETVTNLRKCHRTLELMDQDLDNGFDNCSTHNFYGDFFVEAVKQLKAEKEAYDKKDISLKYTFTDETDEKFAERCEEKSKDLAYEIEKLEDLIKEENLKEGDFDNIYEVHAWW